MKIAGRIQERNEGGENVEVEFKEASRDCV